jgi:hypothetical protein
LEHNDDNHEHYMLPGAEPLSSGTLRRRAAEP